MRDIGNHAVKSKAYRIMDAKRARDRHAPTRARLILDPVEPRVLMNADTLAVQLAAMPNEAQAHEVLVQMINETIEIGTQTQTVQRVQVLDETNGRPILAMGNLAEIKAIAISATSGADKITLDVGSFGQNAIPKLTVQGDGLTALAISHDPGQIDWRVNGDGSGSASGAGADVIFTGVSAVQGNAASDILHGPAPATAWSITAPGAGSLRTAADGPVTAFEGFYGLAGAANNDDSFTMFSGGSIAGIVEGGPGGFDTLGYATGVGGVIVSTPADAHSGTVSAGGVTTRYAGMEPVSINAGSTSTNLVFDLSGAGGQFTLTDNGTGLELSGPNMEKQDFAGTVLGVTIDLGSGGGNTLTLTGANGSFSNGLTIKSEGAGDTVAVNRDLTTSGGAVSIQADNVYVGGDLISHTIDTTLPGGASGAITLAGLHITVEAGSVLNATAVADNHQTPGKAGAIKLAADDTTARIVTAPFAFTVKNVSTTLINATIEGGDITISANATDVMLPGSTGALALGYVGQLASLLNKLPGAAIGALTAVDVSVAQRGANAAVSVAGSSITSSGSVALTSTTQVATVVSAVAMGFLPAAAGAAYDIAAGYGEADSTVSTDISGSTTINATHDVTISATGSTKVSVSAAASANMVGRANNNAFAVTLAIASGNLQDTATVGNGVTINASQGSVNVLAAGSTSINPTATTIVYKTGPAGVSASLGFDTATVNAVVDGKITAAGAVTQKNSFNGAATGNGGAVNTVTGTIHLPNHGLTPGQPITFTAGKDPSTGVANTPVGGLVNGQTYYALPVDKDNLQLSTSPVIALDPTVTAAGATHTLSETTTSVFLIDGVSGANNAISLPGSGFADGDTVVYHANGNTPISGLTDGGSYTLKALDSGDFQLQTADGQGHLTVVPVAQGNTTGTHTFVDGGNSFDMTLAFVDPSNHAINVKAHGLADGQEVSYVPLAQGGVNAIGGLTAGTNYKVHVLSPNSFQLIGEATNLPVAVTDPGVSSYHALSYISEVIPFNPTPQVVNKTASTIYLPGNDLVDGQSVIYNTDPTRPTTHSYVVQKTASFFLNAIDPSSHAIFVPNSAFSAGDSLVYSANGNTPITGLTDGATYTVLNPDQNSFQLGDPSHNNALIPITQGGATGTQYFTNNGNAMPVKLGNCSPRVWQRFPGTFRGQHELDDPQD